MRLKLPLQIWRYSLQNFHVGVEFSSEKWAETAGGVGFGSMKERFHASKLKLRWMIPAEVRNLQAEL